MRQHHPTPKETTMRLPPKKAQDIAEVIEHLAKHETIYYQGPMDHRPWRCQVIRFLVNRLHPERSKVTIECDRIRFHDLGLIDHLDRFWLHQ
jgi:hypothetical protein